MDCKKLTSGFDIGCEGLFRKYHQQVVLINRSDVDQYNITSNDGLHRIQFNLLEGRTGYLFRGNENAGLLNAFFTKKQEKGVPYYSHNVDVVVIGTSENVKVRLKQLDLSNYFAAIQFKNQNVEIYGFNNGLNTKGYEYNAQSGIGGSVISLGSKYDEYEPPYNYYSATITPDFDGLFTNVPDFIGGDFNNDFNSDFNNQYV